MWYCGHQPDQKTPWLKLFSLGLMWLLLSESHSYPAFITVTSPHLHVYLLCVCSFYFYNTINYCSTHNHIEAQTHAPTSSNDVNNTVHCSFNYVQHAPCCCCTLKRSEIQTCFWPSVMSCGVCVTKVWLWLYCSDAKISARYPKVLDILCSNFRGQHFNSELWTHVSWELSFGDGLF